MSGKYNLGTGLSKLLKLSDKAVQFHRTLNGCLLPRPPKRLYGSVKHLHCRPCHKQMAAFPVRRILKSPPLRLTSTSSSVNPSKIAAMALAVAPVPQAQVSPLPSPIPASGYVYGQSRG